jgi:hypothetical protein
MDYKSKSGYSLAYKKKEIIPFSAVMLVIFILLLIFIPKPLGYYLAVGFLLFTLLLLGLGILIMKFQGVTVEIEGNALSIYKTNSKFVEAGINEAVFNFYPGTVQAKCKISLDNIANAKLVTEPAELEKIKKQTKPYATTSVRVGGSRIGTGSILGAGNLILSLSPTDISTQEFITDYSNIVELIIKKLRIIKNIKSQEPKKEIVNNPRILVSIKNSSEFIEAIEKR